MSKPTPLSAYETTVVNKKKKSIELVSGKCDKNTIRFRKNSNILFLAPNNKAGNFEKAYTKD